MSPYVDLEEFNSLKSAYEETLELLARALGRITQLENAVFMCDPEGEIVRDKEDNPVLSSGLTVAIEQPVIEPDVPCPETTLDLKACAIVEHLKEEVKANEFGLFTIDKKELDTFMTEKIDEKLRVKKVSRQLKKDIFRRAIELFSDVVCIRTSPSGNKTKTLTLKQSVKRTNTDSPTRLAGIGIWG